MAELVLMHLDACLRGAPEPVSAKFVIQGNNDMAKPSLRQILQQAKACVVAPCVYDCASARAVEMVGFPAMMLSGGEVSIAMNGVLDYGFTNLTDIEWITSRISQTSPLPLAADIENGYRRSAGGVSRLPSAWSARARPPCSLRIPVTWRSPRSCCRASATTKR